jgi:hypothetical protein
MIRSLGWNPLLTARSPGTHSLVKLTGTLIFIKLGLDNYERIWVQRLDSYFVEYA